MEEITSNMTIVVYLVCHEVEYSWRKPTRIQMSQKRSRSGHLKSTKNTMRSGKQGESRTWRVVHSVVCWVVKMDALLAAW